MSINTDHWPKHPTKSGWLLHNKRGDEVRIVCVDRDSAFPIMCSGGVTYSKDGKYESSSNDPSVLDLVIPQPPKIKSFLTPEQIAEGWVEWHGGECPVWGESSPRLLFRDGEITPIGSNHKASGYHWKHGPNKHDIIAYCPDPYTELKEASKAGKTIQGLYIDGKTWVDLSAPTFLEPIETYRVKPTPLGPEDVKCGDVLRHKNQHLPERAVISKDAEGVVVGGLVCSKYSYGHLQRYFKISRDDGETWELCEKPENK